MSAEDGNQEPIDLALARKIRELDREMTPTRDLWPGIERRIADHPQRRYPSRMQEWMPYGMAASVVLAVAALIVSLSGQHERMPASLMAGAPLDAMQAEYTRVTNPMVKQFRETNKSLDPQTLEDLYRNIAIMEQARREIETQLRENPENRRLVEMLMKVHEQEMDLLRQDFTSPTRSM